MERYKKLEIKGNKEATLGEGAYGVVYKALDQYTNRHVALKKIKLEVEEEGVPTTALREMTLLRQLEHPNVIRLEDVVLEPGRLYLVFELVDMDLKKFMDNSEAPLPPDLVQSYTAQMLSGVAHCHSLGVMHRDLKPQNILVTRDGGLKIADFGLARCFTPNVKPLTVEVITRWYRAPEILLGSNIYTAAVDLWSVGCIIIEMANKRAFVPGDSEIDQLHKIFRILGTPTVEQWPHLASLPYWRTSFPEWQPVAMKNVVPSVGSLGHNLLDELFTYNAVDRISAIDSLSHPYIASVMPQSFEGHSSVVSPAVPVATPESASVYSLYHARAAANFAPSSSSSSSSSSSTSSSSSETAAGASDGRQSAAVLATTTRAHKVTPAMEREALDGDSAIASDNAALAAVAPSDLAAGAAHLPPLGGGGKRARRCSVSSTTTDASVSVGAGIGIGVGTEPLRKKRNLSATRGSSVLDFDGIAADPGESQGGELDGVRHDSRLTSMDSEGDAARPPTGRERGAGGRGKGGETGTATRRSTRLR